MTDCKEIESSMSLENDSDVTTLNLDTNISHTLKQASSKTLDKLLEKACSCTLSEILLSSQIKANDISNYSIANQLRFLTQLAFERFGSSYFTDFCDTIYIKCFLPDRKICLSRQIPVDFKLQLACHVKDHRNHQDPMKKAHTINLGENISDEYFGNLLTKNGVKVNTQDACGTSSLFYTALKSARCDLATDYPCVQVSANMTNEGLPLDKQSDKPSTKCEKDRNTISLIACKFIQFLGAKRFHLLPKCFVLTPDILFKTLEWIRGIFELQRAIGDQPSLPKIAREENSSLHHEVPFLFQNIFLKSLKMIWGDIRSNEKRNELISHIESIQASDVTTSMEAFDNVDSLILGLQKEIGVLHSFHDSEGNTCLHHAARLLFYGVPKEIVIDKVCGTLKRIKAKFNARNHKDETPLLFCLSSKDVATNRPNKGLKDLCKFLVENGSQWHQPTSKGESAFYLILKLCQQAILLPDGAIILEMVDILKMFSQQANTKIKSAVNQRDDNFNTPLHLWASLALTSHLDYQKPVFSNYSFEVVLKLILDVFKECGVKLDDSNFNEETPLHVCRTWTAVKLLLEKVGKRAKVMDSSGNTLLLSAAKNEVCLQKKSDRLYQDVSEDPKEFWKTVLNKELDPWTSNKNEESVLSILIEKEAINLAKALVEIACEGNYVESDTIGIPLLIAICKDQSDKFWKFDLVETLLKSRRSLVGERSSSKDTALHFCCKNVVDLPESAVQNSVHWKIVKHLLLCGADVEAAGETGQSCLQIAETCPALKNLLLAPVDFQRLPLEIENWEPVSEKHSDQLSLIARMIKCQNVENFHFYHEPLERESCSKGFVFVGIDKKDGRELAIKRIKKSSRQSSKSNVLCYKTKCDQIVEYLSTREDPNYYYITFELMEGTLEDLDMASCKENINNLCQQVILGLKFLHSQLVHNQPLVHKNVNPRTVFYRNKPKFCLKIGNCVSESRRGWVPSEVLDSSSDMFSCGLVIHYLLSGKMHPFAPDDVTSKTPDEILDETERNVSCNNNLKLDDSLSPEATHLVQQLLYKNASKRPSAANALVHPLFWSNAIKKWFLHVVANEPDVAIDKSSTLFRNDLEKQFNTIVTRAKQWNDSTLYKQVNDTYNGMKMKKTYNYGSVAGLIRFIRNAYEHINEQPTHIQVMWQKDFVLVDYFPHLVIEVYKTVTLHKWHNSRDKIKEFFIGLNC